MKLLEYEAKIILKNADISVPRSSLISSPTDDVSMPTVIKSQVPAGGRGKAGGIKIVENIDALSKTITDILKLPIGGFAPKVLLAEEKLDIKKEMYVSLLIDQPTAKIQLMAHPDGGTEIEKHGPTSFFTANLDKKNTDSIGEKLADYLDLPVQTFALQEMVKKLYDCFVKNDATLLEINPFILTADNRLVAGDCKMTLDDAATFRHPEWSFEDKPANANFVTLNPRGTVATIANGAGLAMATVDGVKAAGMDPANFLDIGGGANAESIMKAFNKILDYPNIKAIVINIFAGITRCDEVAKAIITARQETPALPPLFIRLAGTNFEQAVQMLQKEGITTLATLEECLDASRKVVRE
jgi:succinyl-CoA synthetase beta subunit